MPSGQFAVASSDNVSYIFPDSWSSIQLQESAKSNPSQSATKQVKKTPRVLRSFAQARIQDKYQSQEVGCTKVGNNDIFAGQTPVPGMSLYEFSQVSDAESQAVGDEETMIFDSDGALPSRRLDALEF